MGANFRSWACFMFVYAGSTEKQLVHKLQLRSNAITQIGKFFVIKIHECVSPLSRGFLGSTCAITDCLLEANFVCLSQGYRILECILPLIWTFQKNKSQHYTNNTHYTYQIYVSSHAYIRYILLHFLLTCTKQSHSTTTVKRN